MRCSPPVKLDDSSHEDDSGNVQEQEHEQGGGYPDGASVEEPLHHAPGVNRHGLEEFLVGPHTRHPAGRDGVTV